MSRFRAGRPTARELFGAAGTPSVAVIGAGFGGIGMGVKLKRAGTRTFTIYESSLGVGGTWWDNTYPGAEVDVGSHLYDAPQVVSKGIETFYSMQPSNDCASMLP